MRDSKVLVLVSMFLLSVFSASAFMGSGSGTSVDPYVITNCLELQDVGSDLAAYYELGNDIDCSDSVNWVTSKTFGFSPIGITSTNIYFRGVLDGKGFSIANVYIVNNDPAENDGGLFERITDSGRVANFSITNMFINYTKGADDNDSSGYMSEVGFVVGFLTSSADFPLQNVRILNSTLYGNHKCGAVTGHFSEQSLRHVEVEGVEMYCRDWLGGITAWGSENISIFNVSLKNSYLAAGSTVGGILGRAQSDSVIVDSAAVDGVVFDEYFPFDPYNRTNKSTTSYDIGGVIGYAHLDESYNRTFTITNSYVNATSNFDSTNTISGGNRQKEGGLVGHVNRGFNTIANSYAIFEYSPTNSGDKGGVIGYNFVQPNGNTRISLNIMDNVFAANVDPNPSNGDSYGLLNVRNPENASIRNSFFSNQGTGDIGCSRITGGTNGCSEVSSTDMLTDPNSPLLSGWDFENTWGVSSPNSLPCLLWEEGCMKITRTCFSGGSGTANDPALICTCGDFQNIGNHEYWTLRNPSYVESSEPHYELYQDLDCSSSRNWGSWYQDGVGGIGFKPINYGKGDFHGTIKGNGQTISDIYMEVGFTDEDHTDFYEKTGVIGTLGRFAQVHNIKFESPFINASTFTNTSSRNSIGIFGWVKDTLSTGEIQSIENITVNNAHFVSSYGVGGVVGHNSGRNIFNCHVTNSQLQGFDLAGGIMGYASSEPFNTSISSVTNSTISANSYVGGLIGAGVSGKVLDQVSVKDVVFTKETPGDEGLQKVGGLIGSIRHGGNNWGEYLIIKDSYVQARSDFDFFDSTCTHDECTEGGLIAASNAVSIDVINSYTNFEHSAAPYGKRGGFFARQTDDDAARYGSHSGTVRTSIQNSFASNSISSTSGIKIRGLFNYTEKDATNIVTFSNSYYDTSSVGDIGCTKESGGEQPGCFKVPDSSLLDELNGPLLSTWDFDTIWGATRKNSDPCLLWEDDCYDVNAKYYYLDSDQDGFAQAGSELRVQEVSPGPGWFPITSSLPTTDCADTDRRQHPGFVEAGPALCQNGIDDDCDGLTDLQEDVCKPRNCPVGYTGFVAINDSLVLPNTFTQGSMVCVDSSQVPEVVITSDSCEYDTALKYDPVTKLVSHKFSTDPAYSQNICSQANCVLESGNSCSGHFEKVLGLSGLSGATVSLPSKASVFSLCCQTFIEGLEFDYDSTEIQLLCSAQSDGFCPEDFESFDGNRISCSLQRDPDCGYTPLSDSQQFFRNLFSVDFDSRVYITDVSNTNGSRVSVRERDVRETAVTTLINYSFAIVSNVKESHSVTRINFSYTQGSPEVSFDGSPLVTCPLNPVLLGDVPCYIWSGDSLEIHHSLSSHTVDVSFTYSSIVTFIGFIIFFAILLPSLLIFGVRYKLFSKHKRKTPEVKQDIMKVTSFVQRKLSEGFTKPKIKHMLESVGWESHIVSLALHGAHVEHKNYGNLQKYIKECVNQNIPKSKVFAALLAAGWDRKDIEEQYEKIIN